jgi:hypothetical protein
MSARPWRKRDVLGANRPQARTPPTTDIRKAKERILFYEVRAQDNPRVRSYYLATLKLVEDHLVSVEITDK